MWLLFAFSGPVLWAMSTHIDKYLVDRYFKHGSVAVLMVFTALIGLAALPPIWWYEPSVLSLALQPIAVIIASGVLYMGAMYFYLQALQSEEASTIAPFFQVTGLFGLTLGYLILGETLSFLQIAGGFLIIAGSVLLSIRMKNGGTRIKKKLVLLMLACALALATSSLIFKFFAVQDEFWSTTFWNFVGEALFGAVLISKRSHRVEFMRMLKKNTGAVLSINATNELINLAGGLGMRYALLLAPLGIVQSITSTGPFFVLFFGIILSLFFPQLGREELTRTGLLQKIIATTLAVVGVLLINA